MQRKQRKMSAQPLTPARMTVRLDAQAQCWGCEGLKSPLSPTPSELVPIFILL